MKDLSVIIASRNEMFLKNTIDDLLKNIRGNTEIIVVLDGQWSDPPLPDNENVIIIYHNTSIGQRAAVNEGVKLSKAKYIIKVDAHCAFDEGFDVKMLEAFKETGDNVTMVPIMKNLHAFDWVCKKCGDRRYQGQTPTSCPKCDNKTDFERDVMWEAKKSPNSTSYCFDPTPHFQYFGEFKKRKEGQGDLTESMSLQGSCWMCTRDKYWELNLGDEEFGSWGSQGIQTACSVWLSGGRVLCNHKTFYAHLFRTQGGDFGFPYHLSGNQVARAKQLAKKKLYENKWPKQIRPLSWLLERFWPVPGWTQKDLDDLKLVGSKFMNQSVFIPGPEGVAGLAKPLSAVNVGREGMTPLAMGHSGFPSTGADTTKNIDSMTGKSQVGGIATSPIITDVVNNGNVFAEPHREGPDKPSIDDSVDTNLGAHVSNSSISPFPNISNPVPAPSIPIDDNLGKKTGDKLGINTASIEKPHVVHAPHIIPQKGLIFYTDNSLNLRIGHIVKKQLAKISQEKHIPIVSCSLKPMDFGKNIVIKAKRGYLTLFRQILAALEASEAHIVYFCEHDVLMHASHFDFTPPRKDIFYFNLNVWKVDWETKRALKVDKCEQLSGMCCYKELALSFCKERIKQLEIDSSNRHFEPQGKRGNWSSSKPLIDIRHDGTLTRNRWSKDQFRNQENTKGWLEKNPDDEIEGWGIIKDILK